MQLTVAVEKLHQRTLFDSEDNGYRAFFAHLT